MTQFFRVFLQVSVSHDEQGTALADQLAELEDVGDDQVDETEFLPPGDLLKVHPDEPRNFSKLLVKIHEQRHITQKSKPTSVVPQLSGHFVHASRYRRLLVVLASADTRRMILVD